MARPYRDTRCRILFVGVAPGVVDVSSVRVRFANNGAAPSGVDRDLRVDAVLVGGVRFEAEDPAVWSTGTWASGSRCAAGAKRSEWLHCTGEFDFAGP